MCTNLKRIKLGAVKRVQPGTLPDWDQVGYREPSAPKLQVQQTAPPTAKPKPNMMADILTAKELLRKPDLHLTTKTQNFHSGSKWPDMLGRNRHSKSFNR